MPRLRRKAKGRIDYCAGHYSELLHGAPMFNQTHSTESKQFWFDLEQMERAWASSEVRADVWARVSDHCPIPWAAILFGDAEHQIAPAADKVRERILKEHDALRTRRERALGDTA